ncbi:MAG: DUF421 domain-containing protein [Betaproteobacteria bacterium]|nr:DUF421 domain-containing protein [Betaproteobacteria bacterium]
MDWDSIFVPDVPVGEIILRGTLVYLALFFVLRVSRRETGGVGISDLLVIVLVADASQNAMAGEYRSLTDGLILVSTIVFWDFFLDWLGYRFAGVERLLRPAPLLLVRNGSMLRQNMKRELISEEELMEKLREQGISRLEEVRRCYMEGDGQVSVVRAK